jgi:hypothetical protein
MARTTTAIPATTSKYKCDDYSYHNQYGCHQDGYTTPTARLVRFPSLQRWCSRKLGRLHVYLLAEVACVWRIYCPRYRRCVVHVAVAQRWRVCAWPLAAPQPCTVNVQSIRVFALISTNR